MFSGSLHPLTALQEALDLGEMTSTTTALHVDSQSESSESGSEDDMDTTIDMADSRAIRRQLEGLETMYSSVIPPSNRFSDESDPFQSPNRL